MDVKTTMLYTHVLNVAVEWSAVRSTGCGRLSQTRSAGLTGPTGRPKTGEGSCCTRQKWLRPASAVDGFVLGRPGSVLSRSA